MKIHFRRVDGERTMFLELDGAFCGFGSQEYRADLPGEPLKYSDMNATLLKRLRDEHFLDVDADMAATWGNVTLQLPDPVTLLKATMPGDWKQAQDRVTAEIADMPEFQAFAQWWETLRRSEAFRRDCDALREELAMDAGLTWAAFIGHYIPFFQAGFSTEEDRSNTCNFMKINGNSNVFFTFKNALGNYNIEKTSMDCRYTWGTEYGNYSYLWPQFSTFEILHIYRLAIQALWETQKFNLLAPAFKNKKRKSKAEDIFYTGIFPIPSKINFNERILPPNFLKTFNTLTTDNEEGLCFMIPFPGMEKASGIITALFKSKIYICDFQISENEISFEMLFDKENYKEGVIHSYERAAITEELEEKITCILAEAIGTDLPTVQPWNERRTVNREAFRRQLAAFDKRTDEDAKLWPGQTGKDLSNLKSRARIEFKKRLARLEHAAEQRRRTLTTD